MELSLLYHSSCFLIFVSTSSGLLFSLSCFESPTESDLETGKQMFYQKNNLQYAATDAMVSWKRYPLLKSLPDAKDTPLTIQDHHPLPSWALERKNLATSWKASKRKK
ncbi:hypothetical protein NC653_003360 [Populus alba x Populus x berolinensis]|uniref:Uncharacterized protein n=1 Tax=Populus alba x Populus x berolinensis TaxID=444605 RepID=A0AAD6WKK1_9ROSI|nr:hypothetical protein NC653_003360 [Populus alba x Populus x berolinensis]